MLVHRARNIACAAGASSTSLSRFRHRSHYVRVMTHSEVVVGAPYGDLTLALGTVVVGLGERAAAPFHLREDAVVALFLQLVELIGKQRVKIHPPSSLGLPLARVTSSPIVLHQAVAEPSASVQAMRAR